jgi:hypothetical protein
VTLSGTPATFRVGGEVVFRVAGDISGDIKPYPFGTTLNVTPALLLKPTEDGNPRVHMKIEAIERASSISWRKRGQTWTTPSSSTTFMSPQRRSSAWIAH